MAQLWQQPLLAKFLSLGFNEKRQGENQPYGKAFTRISESAFPKGHPYSWSTIGSMDDLDAASLEDVQDWFKTYYGPNNAVF